VWSEEAIGEWSGVEVISGVSELVLVLFAASFQRHAGHLPELKRVTAFPVAKLGEDRVHEGSSMRGLVIVLR
jgi:hypothetical protein